MKLLFLPLFPLLVSFPLLPYFHKKDYSGLSVITKGTGVRTDICMRSKLPSLESVRREFRTPLPLFVFLAILVGLCLINMLPGWNIITMRFHHHPHPSMLIAEIKTKTDIYQSCNTIFWNLERNYFHIHHTLGKVPPFFPFIYFPVSLVFISVSLIRWLNPYLAGIMIIALPHTLINSTMFCSASAYNIYVLKIISDCINNSLICKSWVLNGGFFLS